MKKIVLTMALITASSAMADSPDMMEKCAAMKSDEARLACFDKLVLFVRELKKMNKSQKDFISKNEQKTKDTTALTITGAFGYAFGNSFDVKQAKSVETQYNGIKTYFVTPPKAHQLFKKYRIEITPNSHEIYKIVGEGRLKNETICQNKKEAIVENLLKKYRGKRESVGTTLFIQKNDKSIMLDCNYADASDFRSYDLSITYRDKTVENKANREAVEAESKKVNTEGL